MEKIDLLFEIELLNLQRLETYKFILLFILTNFFKIHFLVVQERCSNLKSRSRVDFKLPEKLRPSIKKVSEKCQKSLSGGNGSALRAVIGFSTIWPEGATLLGWPKSMYYDTHIIRPWQNEEQKVDK